MLQMCFSTLFLTFLEFCLYKVPDIANVISFWSMNPTEASVFWRESVFIQLASCRPWLLEALRFIIAFLNSFGPVLGHWLQNHNSSFSWHLYSSDYEIELKLRNQKIQMISHLPQYRCRIRFWTGGMSLSFVLLFAISSGLTNLSLEVHAFV